MAVTQQELDSFHRYAAEQLQKRGDAVSIEELLAQWRAARARAEANAAIAEGLDQMRAGLGRPLDEFVTDFRDRHQISPDA